MTNDIKKNFCAVPWFEPYVNSYGSYSLCCAEQENDVDSKIPINENFQHHWNGKYLKNTRIQILQGQLPKQCNICERNEAIGKDSLRQRRNYRYLGQHEPTIDNPKLKQIQDNTLEDGSLNENFPFEGFLFTVGRTCQLGCVTCSDVYSTFIEKEYKVLKFQSQFKDRRNINHTIKLDQKTFDENLYTVLKTHIDHLDKLHITGGEPFLSKKLFQFLEWCYITGHHSHLTLYITTNGMTMPSMSNLKILEKFKEVILFFSCDAVGDLEEYIRFPSVWTSKKRNLEIFKNHFPNITICCTVFAMNCHAVSQVIDYAIDSQVKITLTTLEEPNFLHVKNLPMVYKDKVMASLRNHILPRNYSSSPWLQSHVDSIVNAMEMDHDVESFKKITDMITAYDKIRPINFYQLVETFPKSLLV